MPFDNNFNNCRNFNNDAHDNNDSSNRIKVGETINILEKDIKNYLDFKYFTKSFSYLNSSFQFIIRNPLNLGTKLLTRRRWSYHFWYSIFRVGLLFGLYFYYYNPKITCNSLSILPQKTKTLFLQKDRKIQNNENADNLKDEETTQSSQTVIKNFKWKIEGKPLNPWKRILMTMNDNIDHIPTQTIISAHSIYWIDSKNGKAYRHIIDWLEPINMPKWWLSGLNVYYKICNIAFKPKMNIHKTK